MTRVLRLNQTGIFHGLTCPSLSNAVFSAHVQRQDISAVDVFQAKGIMSDHGSSCKICSSCAVQGWFFDGNISVEEEPDNDLCLIPRRRALDDAVCHMCGHCCTCIGINVTAGNVTA